VVTARTETDFSLRERADARLGEELVGEEQLDDSSLAIFASVELSSALRLRASAGGLVRG